MQIEQVCTEQFQTQQVRTEEVRTEEVRTEQVRTEQVRTGAVPTMRTRSRLSRSAGPRRLTRPAVRLAAAVALSYVALAGVLSMVDGPSRAGGTLSEAVAATLRQEPLSLETQNGRVKLTVEIARTDPEKALGLMYRTSLPPNHGMLFVYDRPQEITMWMRNTYIPLDMLFIRADGIVHRIAAQTEPFSEEIISSQGPASFVLELAGGSAERLKLKPGDRVVHQLFASGR